MKRRAGKRKPAEHERPIWDHGGAVDAEMLRFTIGDDWLQDRRLVEVDILGSMAHAEGLERAGLLEAHDLAAIRGGLEQLLASWRNGEWDVAPGDEDVHSAVERRLIEEIGEAGKRLHLGRSRNDQIALDVRLWLRGAIEATRAVLERVTAACTSLDEVRGELALPGYTHLRRAMPSSVHDWIGAYRAAFAADLAGLDDASRRIAACPLGSGAGYGMPLELDREGVARDLGFDGPEEPVTLTQLTRGRAELAYLTALEGIAIDLGKLAFDLWLFSSVEFGFVHLPEELTTGSSLMPHKRNPDLIELVRAHCRQAIADRAALLDVIRDLPAGYHRDFQLLKPPLFRAHDRMVAALPLAARLLERLEFDERALRKAAADPDLKATAKALERAARGEPFRDVHRAESQVLKKKPG
ncbi:MAG: argininosuccinate lyase [Planctomycetota bacterium]|nr:argininosuccinate lyase [Planctomycetota bacterium]